VLDARLELLAEDMRLLCAHVDLILRALEPEPHRLLGRAAVQIVFQRDPANGLAHLPQSAIPV
jgi:hypothetical protein